MDFLRKNLSNNKFSCSKLFNSQFWLEYNGIEEESDGAWFISVIIMNGRIVSYAGLRVSQAIHNTSLLSRTNKIELLFRKKILTNRNYV